MPRINVFKIILTLFPILILILWLGFKPVTNSHKPFKGQRLASLPASSEKNFGGKPSFNPNHKIVFPLVFPIKGLTADFIKSVPDSRFPGAPRAYRGANATHMGVDLYTGKCGMEVVSPSSGWIIDVSAIESFPNSTVRNALLEIAEKAGFTPEPLLGNLHGISLVIFHGWDENGRGYYSRMSHLDRLAADFKLGDFVGRGEVVGFVGATGTSAQFKSGKDRDLNCHLHFEWHVLNERKDIVLGLDEKDFHKKRNLYLELFK